MRIAEHLANLYAHLVENHYQIQHTSVFDPTILDILSRDVLKKIKEQDVLWENMVPVPVARAIKRRGLFIDSRQQLQTELQPRQAQE